MEGGNKGFHALTGERGESLPAYMSDQKAPFVNAQRTRAEREVLSTSVFYCYRVHKLDDYEEAAWCQNLHVETSACGRTRNPFCAGKRGDQKKGNVKV